ncbi:MAG TPA: ABC transporter substrate-binding protein [Thermomicrobiales bacterium]|nr:ABC transporter substrate-binding protein [Thermomicrobiales bacterium]
MQPERTQQAFTRRAFLAGLAVAAGGALLAACGGAAATNTPAAAPTTAPTAASGAATSAPTPAATTAPTTAATTAAGAASPAATKAASAAASPSAAAASPAASGPGGGGGTMTGGFDVGPGGNPQGFNVITAGAGYMWMEKYFSKLLEYDVKFTKLQGENAESWEVAPDAKKVTFHLRQGITWHDGQPFTSDDAKFSIELFQNPDSASPYRPKFVDISSIDTPDPNTLVVNLSKPNVAILDALTYVFMLPKHAIGNIAPKDLVKHQWWQTNPIGTGPFKWSKYVTDQYVELAPNPKYWRGAPKLDKLINRYFKEAGSSLIALQKGEIQFTYVTLDESQVAAKDANLTVIPGPSQVVNYLQFNLKDKRFQDVRVRQAFMYAIDRKAIVDQLFKGAAVVVQCPFNQQALLPDGLNDYKADPNKAKQLLQAANWDSIKGDPIEVLTYYADQLSQDVLVTMQQQLSDVGISIKIRAVDVPTFNSLRNGTWSMYYAGAANGVDPDVTSIYFVSDATPPAGGNYGYYSNPQVDKDYAAGRAETDQTKRNADYQDVSKILNQDVPWAFMWVTTRFGAVSKKVQNFLYTPSAGSGRYYDQAEKWTVS